VMFSLRFDEPLAKARYFGYLGGRFLVGRLHFFPWGSRTYSLSLPVGYLMLPVSGALFRPMSRPASYTPPRWP